MRTMFLVSLFTLLVSTGTNHADEDPPSAVEVKTAYVEQLLQVLSKTRSTDTFLVTLELLVESKPEKELAAAIVPAVILQAERVGIFGDHLIGEDTQKAELASGVKELILQLQKSGKSSTPARSFTPSNRVPAQNYSSSLPPVPTEQRTPIQPPLPQNQPAPAVPEPSDAQILRVVTKESPAVVRDDVKIVKEKIVDRVDPPRFFPLVGVAQLRHVHWKCTAYYNEQVGETTRPRVQVVYIDADQLHLTK